MNRRNFFRWAAALPLLSLLPKIQTDSLVELPREVPDSLYYKTDTSDGWVHAASGKPYRSGYLRVEENDLGDAGVWRTTYEDDKPVITELIYAPLIGRQN